MSLHSYRLIWIASRLSCRPSVSGSVVKVVEKAEKRQDPAS
jgi:hypothetical protein